MKSIIERRAELFCSLMFGLVLLAAAVVSGVAQDKFNKGDEVIVDIYGDGRQVCDGIVESVNRYSSGTFYSIKWDCGDGYHASNSGQVPASRLRPRGEAKGNPPADPPKEDNPPPDDYNSDSGVSASDSEVSINDLNWFFSKWKLSRFGGGSEVERGGRIYRETLMYVAKAAPITINSNGTYSWIVRDGSTLKGKWRKLRPEEDRVSNGKNGLVLLKGFDGVDWNVSFMGIQNGKEFIKISSHLGNFDGERIGAGKGEPEWNRIQFSVGDSVIVTLPGDEQCSGVVEKLRRSYDGIVLYSINFTCQGAAVSSGSFPAHKIRRR